MSSVTRRTIAKGETEPFVKDDDTLKKRIRKEGGGRKKTVEHQATSRLARLLSASQLNSLAEPPGIRVAVQPLAKPREVPLFGQVLMLGETLTLEPADVTVNAMLVAGSDLAPSAALQAIRAMAREGSAAEKLFKLGEAAPAPPGRADDFSAPPAATE